LKWLDEFVNPQKFIIEITGGEPGLYKEINTLIPALNDRGYHGIIKTNGSLRIPKSRNFQLITSWHSWQVGLPKYYDQILIIKNPSDNWTSKVEYCKQHKIPYRLTLFDEYYLTGKPSICGEYNRTKFINITHINNQGQVMECPKARPDFYKSIFHSSVPPLKNLRSDCSRCNVANNVEVLLPDKLMQMIENDNKNQRII
jgi:organic radical activating enzyme